MFGLQKRTNKLVEALQGAFGVVVSCAVPAREMAGVRNGYQDFERLGLDRWLAMLGGFKLARARAWYSILVPQPPPISSRQTASTWAASFAPGMPLMRNQLRTHTRKIRYDDAGG